jgi:peptide/nickel transport system permease protein
MTEAALASRAPDPAASAPSSRRRVRPLRHVTFSLGVAISALLVFTAALSLVWTPADPLAMSIARRLQGPTAAHPFGTDQYGRDILARVMTGAVTSIAVGVIAVGIGAGAGMLLGMASGYVGGWVDEGLMRLIDAVQGFPAILSALLFTAVFGPGITVSMVAIGLAFVPAFARLTRGSFLELRGREFVVAARALGASDRRLSGRHILPNTLAPLIVQATTSFPVAILAEAALAYLGLGTQPPHPSWGLMLKEAQNFLSLSPAYAIFPGGAIALTVLGLNLLGDGLRDLLDPKTA